MLSTIVGYHTSVEEVVREFGDPTVRREGIVGTAHDKHRCLRVCEVHRHRIRSHVDAFAVEEALAGTEAEDRRLCAELFGEFGLFVAGQALGIVQAADERRCPAVYRVGGRPLHRVEGRPGLGLFGRGAVECRVYGSEQIGCVQVAALTPDFACHRSLNVPVRHLSPGREGECLSVEGGN